MRQLVFHGGRREELIKPPCFARTELLFPGRLPGYWMLAIILFFWTGGDLLSQVMPREKRILSIDLNQAEEGGFELSMAKAREVGSQTVSLSLPWDEVEIRPGIFEPNPNWLQIANLYYPNQGMRLAVGVNPIDTNRLRMPADLAEKAFDDPEVIRRFKAVLDWVFDQIPDLDLAALIIGNEIDGYLGNEAARWHSYSRFLNEAIAHVKAKRPNLVIGTKVMFFGFADKGKTEFVRKVNAKTDVWMLTYYPLKADFTVRDPTDVPRDFDWLVRQYSGKPIYFMEIGYPSGSACLSSEAKQAEFIRQLFKGWDRYSKQIGYMSITWLTDIPSSATDHYVAYYGLEHPGFRGFLGTLGLRTYKGTGQDKVAFRVLVEEARKRDWGSK